MSVLSIVVAASVTLSPGPASRRFAIVAGNDPGTAGAPAPRHAERDAAHFSRALTEIGDVAPSDVLLLQGRKLAELEAAIARIKDRIAELHRRPGSRAMLIFFFSGRADGQSLELGPERLSHTKLKALLQASGADLRVEIVDGLPGPASPTAEGRAVPGFTLTTEDRMQAQGEAFIAASSWGAPARDPGAPGGSAFSHHLIAGLRGAADRSGDQKVSLDELVRYVSSRSAASAGGQQPGAGFRAGSQGELILANVKRARTALELPEGAEQLTVSDPERKEVLAQLDSSAARVLALPPGRYLVRAQREGKAFAGRVVLGQGLRGSLAWEQLRPEGKTPASGGGWMASLTPLAGDVPEPAARRIGMSVLPFQSVPADPVLEAIASAMTQAVSAEVRPTPGVHLFRPTGARIEAREVVQEANLEVLSPPSLEKLQKTLPGSELVVLGVLRSAGPWVNATVYLVDVGTGRVLEASHGARPRATAAGFPEEVARELGAALRAALERRRPR